MEKYENMKCGNNETLRPNESESLSKKLKGYHMLIKRPDNIFFTLYSNTTMDKLEKYTEKYFSYTMHQYKDDEIDVEDNDECEKHCDYCNAEPHKEFRQPKVVSAMLGDRELFRFLLS